MVKKSVSNSSKNLFVVIILLIILLLAIFFIISFLKLGSSVDDKQDANNQTSEDQIPQPPALPQIPQVPEVPQTQQPNNDVPVVEYSFCMSVVDFEIKGWCPKNPDTGKQMFSKGYCTTSEGKPGVLCK